MAPRAWPRIPPRAARLAVLVAIAVPTGAAAQQGCELGPGSEQLTRQPDGRGGSVIYLSRPYFQCEDDVEIWADSAVAYTSDAMSILIGSVRYRDRSRELTSDEARYFTSVGRLQAQGHIAVENRADSSRVDNGDLVYLRQTTFREVESMTFTTGRDGLRPRAMIPPPRSDSTDADSAAVEPGSLLADSTRAAPDSLHIEDLATTIDSADAERNSAPYVVVADQITFLGAGYFSASGRVEIERDSLFAYADSAEYTGESENLVLSRSARVVSADYELVGRTITMGSTSGGASEVRAERNALLTGEDLTLTAPVIKLYMVEGAVRRLVAVSLERDSVAESVPDSVPDSARDRAAAGAAPTSVVMVTDSADAAADSSAVRRPLAVSEGFELTADSLELIAPEAAVEQIFASGQARSVSYGRDVLNIEALPEIARQDWLEGDTIVIDLAPAAPDTVVGGDSGRRQYEIETIVARVGARSLYRLPPQDSTAHAGIDPPAVHYVVGSEITIHMNEGEVEEMEVTGQTRGVHLEPLGQPATADAAAPDSSSVRPPEPGRRP